MLSLLDVCFSPPANPQVVCHQPPGSCPGCLSPHLTPLLLIGELHAGFYEASTGSVYLFVLFFFWLFFLKEHSP